MKVTIPVLSLSHIVVCNQPTMRANMYVAHRPESPHLTSPQICKFRSMKSTVEVVISETRAIYPKERRVRSTWLKLEHTDLAVVQDEERRDRQERGWRRSRNREIIATETWSRVYFIAEGGHRMTKTYITTQFKDKSQIRS